MDIPDAQLPSGLASAYNLGNVSNSIGIYGGSWRMSSLDLRHSEYMQINGHVRIYVSGNTTVSGSARFIIQPGATLEFYSGGSIMIAGNGVVNLTDRAINNRFYGLNSSTTWSIAGNGQWVGTVYAPNARVRLLGGGVNGDMSGSIIGKSITLDGQVSFHYDESLNTNNRPTGYLVASWQSLRLEGGSWVPE